MGKYRAVVAVANQKGGTGKTTTVVNLAAALALMRDRVLVVDLDAQGSATRGLGVAKDGSTLVQALVERLPLDQCVKETAARGVSVVPGGRPLAFTEIHMAQARSTGHDVALRKCLETTKGDWEWVFLDCGPSLGLLTINALAAATHLLIPTEAAPYSFDGLGDLSKTFQQVREDLNTKLELGGLVICRAHSRRAVHRESLEILNERFPGKVAPTVIRENVAVTEAPGHGLPVLKYAPRSNGAQDYIELARWLRKEISDGQEGSAG